MNVGTKKMGPELSEVLVLGVKAAGDGTIFLKPESTASLGFAVF